MVDQTVPITPASEDELFSDDTSLPLRQQEQAEYSRRVPINNLGALAKSHKSLAIDASAPFSTQQTVGSKHVVEVPDIHDDLSRELAFYKQCLSAVYVARKSLAAEGVAIVRPTDYFAEMVKSDEHMDHVKAKITASAEAKKLAADSRKQRDLKKFGKAVQVAKLRERDRARRDALNAIQLVKRSMNPCQACDSVLHI